MLHSLSRLITWLENGIMASLLTAMIILACSQIVMRNVWDAGIVWSEPLLRILVLWLGLLGAIAATRDNSHISVDMLSRLMPPLGKRLAGLLANGFSVVICALIAYHATRFVLMEKADGLIAFGTVPAWICETIIPIGFGLMALRFAIAFGGDLIHPPPEHPPFPGQNANP